MAMYLPGRRLTGVSVSERAVEIAVVATMDRPLPETADEVRRAVTDLARRPPGERAHRRHRGGTMNNQRLPLIGMTVGIVLGIVGAFGGLVAFLIVLVLGAVGYLVGRLAETGEVNLSRLSERRR
ncbi:DUF2273 domain-containing protein [Nonomuraea sp. NPDC049784]|uniref:DUF2273 domain-containing protein n=1 Tax=Nonomuraea sp. NPDC049784 TaxID=3154361 RepID=UPI0033FEBE14